MTPRNTPSRWRRWRRRLAQTLIVMMLCSVALVAGLRYLAPVTSAFMLERRAYDHLTGQGSTDIRYRWRDWSEQSPLLAMSVIAAEDQHFSKHHGFDTLAIRNALSDHLEGKPLRGASTITQQTAKNVFLWPSQNFLRKGLEAWFTVWMELLLPKRRILEIYLNVAEFGDGIYGSEAAARHYFGVSAHQLSAQQASLLAALLPSPRRYRIDPPSEYMLERSRWIRAQVVQLGGMAYLSSL